MDVAQVIAGARQFCWRLCHGSVAVMPGEIQTTRMALMAEKEIVVGALASLWTSLWNAKRDCQ
jgi:hypothetical protein